MAGRAQQARHRRTADHAAAPSAAPARPDRSPSRRAAVGSAAPRSGHRDDPGHAPGRAASPTHPPERSARPGRRSPPASPSTVAGPTAGAASRLAATATRLTWPEIAATSGVQASCAAGGHRDRLGHPARQPAGQRVAPGRARAAGSRPVASTDSANPAVTASPGRPAAARRRRRRAPRRAAVAGRRRPSRAAPTVPIAAARTHAGLGAREQHEPDDAQPRRRGSSQRPRTPHPAGHHQEEPDDQRQVGARHRQQVGQPGRPEVVGQRRVDARRRRRRPGPAPAPGWRPGGWATESRSEARTRVGGAPPRVRAAPRAPADRAASGARRRRGRRREPAGR